MPSCRWKFRRSTGSGGWRLRSMSTRTSPTSYVNGRIISVRLYSCTTRVHARARRPLLNIQASVQISNGRLKTDICLDRSLMSLSRGCSTPTFSKSAWSVRRSVFSTNKLSFEFTSNQRLRVARKSSRPKSTYTLLFDLSLLIFDRGKGYFH